MVTRIEAIYEGGILRPLQPVALAENEHVTLTIDPVDDDIDYEFHAYARAEVAKLTKIPTLEEVRELLSTVPGSFADSISSEREER